MEIVIYTTRSYRLQVNIRTAPQAAEVFQLIKIIMYVKCAAYRNKTKLHFTVFKYVQIMPKAIKTEYTVSSDADQ